MTDNAYIVAGLCTTLTGIAYFTYIYRLLQRAHREYRYYSGDPDAARNYVELIKALATSQLFCWILVISLMWLSVFYDWTGCARDLTQEQVE